MTYSEIGDGSVHLMGYPVGEIKLRKDIAIQYSDLAGHLEPTLVRNEEKLVIDLRHLHPDRVVEGAVLPEKTVICLLDRSGEKETTFERIDPKATLSALWVEALHLDARPFLEANLQSLVELVSRSTCYRLSVGTDIEKIVRVVDAL